MLCFAVVSGSWMDLRMLEGLNICGEEALAANHRSLTVDDGENQDCGWCDRRRHYVSEQLQDGRWDG